LGIVRRLARSFGTKVKVLKWWQEREGLSPVQRLGEFIEEVLLAEINQTIVIFIDEIDSVLRLDFKDDFFALIRGCYNQRAENPEYQRLTFALLGVATPSDLIQDKSRTPFNVGTAINLQGFQLSEVQPLAQGLEGRVDNPQAVLREILAWTGGQPFLTQKLCQLILSSPFTIASDSEAELIEGLVRSRIIENWESQDEPEHLKTIRDRILRDQQRAGRRLGLYQQILQQGEIAVDDSYDQMDLRLSGLVVEQQGKLRVYNRIYEAVFDQDWIDRALADLRPYAALIAAWLASNYHDESRLLRGQALRDAQAWAVGKSLGDKDYQFLAASQELDKREVLEAEKQAKQILAEAQRKAELALEEERNANQGLAEAQGKTKQQIRLGAAAMVIMLVIATVVGVQASQKIEEAKRTTLKAQENTRDAVNKQKNAESQTKREREGLKKVLTNQKLAEKEAQKAQRNASTARERLKRAESQAERAKSETQGAKEEAISAKIDVQKVRKIAKKSQQSVEELKQEQRGLEEKNKKFIRENNNFLNERTNEKFSAEKMEFRYLSMQVAQKRGYVITEALKASNPLSTSVPLPLEVKQEPIIIKRRDNTPLKRNDISIEILKIQGELRNSGCYEAPFTTLFGWLTEVALRRFQSANQLDQLDMSSIPLDTQVNNFSENILLQNSKIARSCSDIYIDIGIGINRVLRQGDQGPDILQIQRRLQRLGYYLYQSADGVYGSATRNAVIKFQQDYGLSPDGVLGYEALQVILDLFSPQLGDYSFKVLVLQTQLIKVGFGSVPVHGIYDQATAEAIRQFQEKKGLTPTGISNWETLDYLGLSKLFNNSYIVIERRNNDESENTPNSFWDANTYSIEGMFDDRNAAEETALIQLSKDLYREVVDRNRALESVFRLQHWLQDKKFYKQALDGIWSPETEAAWKAAYNCYEKRNCSNLEVTVPRQQLELGGT
jgi:peptidoglycan hydrolase-like protein with peptidoglycan-binding domain